MPAFIIEELEDGRFTVIVRTVDSDAAGPTVYILNAERVHPLNAAIPRRRSKPDLALGIGIEGFGSGAERGRKVGRSE